MEYQMAVFSGALKNQAPRIEVNITSNSIFHNLMYVAFVATILWSAIGYAIAG